MSLLSNAFNCPTQEKHAFQSQKWSSAGVSIRMVAGHAFSGWRSLTFNITERWEVESQVPYMHIWPPANVRGGRSCTLLFTLLQGCTVASITRLMHRFAIQYGKCIWTAFEEQYFKFRTNGEGWNHFSLKIHRMFCAGKNKEQPTRKPRWKNFKYNHRFYRATFDSQHF